MRSWAGASAHSFRGQAEHFIEIHKAKAS